MCIIEQFDVVQPDGIRHARERVLVCARGTPTKPCDQVQTRRVGDRPAALGADPTADIPEREPGRRPTPVISEEDEGESSSLPKPKYEHDRPFGSLSLLNKYETTKVFIKLRDIVHSQRERKRERAINDRREREKHERERREVARLRESLAAEQEAGHQQESDREQARMRQKQEDLECLKAEPVRQLRNEQARRRWEGGGLERRNTELPQPERKDRETRWAKLAERARRSLQQEDFERAQSMGHRVPEDIERLNAANKARRLLEELRGRRLEEDETGQPVEEEYERRWRARRATIPRQPRHQPALHSERKSMEDRGERFIREAIPQNNLEEFERRTLHGRDEVVVEGTLKRHESKTSSEPKNRTIKQDEGQALSEYQEEKLLKRNLQFSDLGPGSQLHEASPKHDTDDLASLHWLLSFADAGYESQKMPSDHSELQDGADQLSSLLLNDPELKTLFEEAFQRSKSRERFISKFRILLKIYGTELKKEATNASHEAAVVLAQVKATYVATKIKEAYETGDPNTQDETRSAHLKTQLQRGYDLSSDSDSEAEEPYEGAKLAPFSLEELRAFMTTSKAFANMRSSFRRMVYPDPLTAISNAIFKEHESIKPHSTTVSSSATFHIHWDVGDYINTELGYDSKLRERKQLLESVLVVVGSASTAYATSAINYVRWRWPRSDYEILQFVYSTLTGTSIDAAEAENGPDKPKIITALHGKTKASFHVTGSLEQVIVVAQQLAWIAASFRVPLYGQVSYSEVLIRRTGDMVFELFPTPLEEVRERVGACWLPLFMNSIIARGHAVPAREGEKGIEIPFPLMLTLANVMYPIFHDDGIYLRGFSNLLFPAHISSDMKSVQWHLTTSTTARSHLPYGTLPATTDDLKWAKCDDFEQLALAPRTFLGCYRQVHVDLGTAALTESITKITYSNADNEKPAAGMTQKSVTTGFPGMGIWSAQVNMEFVIPKGLISIEEPGWYLDMLDLAKDTPLIVYDNANTAKRAWLVPQLSVVLHMAHIWACNKTDLLRPIPTAVPHWDSSEAALGVLKRHSKDELRDGLEVDKIYCLRDLIGRLLMTLHNLAETEALAKREPSRTIKLGGSKLYGWELLDVVRGKKSIFRKQIDISQDWMVLGEESVVLFCQNFGDVIKPAPNIRLCPKARSVHQGQNQLTATIKCLQRLSEERCGLKDSACLRIANQAYWLSPGDELFKDCTHGTGNSHTKATKCEKLPQQILRGYVNPITHETPPIEGAVTFGKRRLQRPIAPAQTAPRPTNHEIRHMSRTALEAKKVSAPQVNANLANVNGNAIDNTTGNAHGSTNSDVNDNTNSAPLSKAESIVHRRKSTFSSLISRIAARLERKGEEKLAPPLRNDVPCQPEVAPATDLQVESKAYNQPHRTGKASVTRETFRQPMTQYLTQDKEERPKQSDHGISNARIRQTRGTSVAHEPLHRPTSHPPRVSAAHHSLRQPTSDLPVHNIKETSKRNIEQIINAGNPPEIAGRVQPSMDQPPPAGNRLRRSVRRSDVAYRNGKRSHPEGKKTRELRIEESAVDGSSLQFASRSGVERFNFLK